MEDIAYPVTFSPIAEMDDFRCRYHLGFPIFDTIHTFFTCRLSLRGRCHVWLWPTEFSGVAVSCFTLSRLTILSPDHKTGNETRSTHRSTQDNFFCSMLRIKKLVNTLLFLLFSPVQFKMESTHSEKPICAPPRLRSFPNVAFETVPIFV